MQLSPVGSGQPVFDFQFSEDGTRVIYSFGNDFASSFARGLQCVPIEGGSATTLVSTGSEILWRWIVESGFVAYEISGEVFRIPDSGGATTTLIQPPAGLTLSEWELSPDGNTVAYLYTSFQSWEINAVPLAGGASTLLASGSVDAPTAQVSVPQLPGSALLRKAAKPSATGVKRT